jgi:DNA polymerase III epsilon subunit-like protein
VMSIGKNARPPLALELIPQSMWRKNVRAVVSKQVWDTFRWDLGATKEKPCIPLFPIPEAYEKRQKRACRICDAKTEEMRLHEVWHYDDRRRRQRLVGLIPVCDDCHMVLHMGFAVKLGKGHCAIAHLAKVNAWTYLQAERHIEQALGVWKERSQYTYEQDYSFLHRWITPAQVHLDWLDQPKRWVGDRFSAIEWARGILESKAVIFDSETTGLLTYPGVEPVELAVVTMQGKTIYTSRFRPRKRIPGRVSEEIHGIFNEDVFKEPKFEDQYPVLEEVLRGRVVVAYNAEFDSTVLERTCKRLLLSPPDCRWECAMWHYKAYMESAQFLKLPGRSHNATSDCRATLRLIKRMARGV